MFDLIKNVFRNKTIKPKPLFPLEIVNNVSFIKKMWNMYPVNLEVSFCDTYEKVERFPRNGEKKDLYIGIFPWASRGVDIVLVTKHQLTKEYVLDKTFDRLTQIEIREMGLLPNEEANLVCKACMEFSTNVSIDSLCQDCY
ncbi:hypothetical protein [Sutcliffiella cohnii]|uniref:hypothetical protein n=1 Tax=Sutcliffiella cohnii TaxID=33932 RepID=UPI0008317AB1|nr:hypothetical protein [Sutcliffiella cohnii]